MNRRESDLLRGVFERDVIPTASISIIITSLSHPTNRLTYHQEWNLPFLSFDFSEDRPFAIPPPLIGRFLSWCVRPFFGTETSNNHRHGSYRDLELGTTAQAFSTTKPTIIKEIGTGVVHRGPYGQLSIWSCQRSCPDRCLLR